MLISAKISPSAGRRKSRQRRRQQDLPEVLPVVETKAAADVEQHVARAGEALDGLQDHRREPGGEADHHDRRRAAAEDHQEQRVHQHDRRGRERGDPRLAWRCAAAGTGKQHADARRPRRRASRSPTALPASSARSDAACLPRRRCAGIAQGPGRQRHDEPVDRAGSDQRLQQREHTRPASRRRAPVPRTTASAASSRASFRALRCLDSSSRMPRLASSRRSFQICAT